MPESVYVYRITEVRVPDKGTPERDAIEAAVRRDVGNDEDAAIICNSNGALAVWLAYQIDGGNFTETEGSFSDTQIRDVPPDIEEYELA